MADVRLPTPVTSGDLILDRRFEWARESFAAGDATVVSELLGDVVRSAPGFAPAWFLLAEARETLGDRDGAIDAYRQALAADEHDRQGAAVRLARLGALPPVAMPVAYIRSLFDGYAPGFEDSLVGRLGYRGPELLMTALARVDALNTFDSVLDLGCGTGLAGTAIKPHAQRLTGVDLSPRMLAAASAKGVYDRLTEGECMTFLREEALAGARHDLVLAADVFIYFHELMQVPRFAVPVMTPGALLAFSVETHDGDGVILRDTLRYAHGEAHVRHALKQGGLEIVLLESAPARNEKGEPVPGLVVVARTKPT
ncbi:MAG TPA: methyltransferase [Pseudolabrys sp.]|nr:methyltransferase [Pseudolabrys sp.]